MTEFKIAAIIGVVALIFALGFGTSHVQATAKIKTIQAEQAQAVASANASALMLQKSLDAERDRKATAVADIDHTQTTLLRAQQDENEKFKRCIADGTCGLRIAAKCPARPSAVPGTAPSASVDTSATAVLTADAGRAYSTLRDTITIKERQLAACQGILRTLTAQ